MDDQCRRGISNGKLVKKMRARWQSHLEVLEKQLLVMQLEIMGDRMRLLEQALEETDQDYLQELTDNSYLLALFEGQTSVLLLLKFIIRVL